MATNEPWGPAGRPPTPPLPRSAARSRARAAVHLLGALVLVGAGAWVLLEQTQVRQHEATIAAHAVARLMGTTAEPIGEGAFRFGTGFEARGLRITGECSIGPMVGGALVATGALMALRGRFAASFLSAGAAAIALVLAANVVRLGVIAWAYRTWGYPGYEVAHVYVGSVLIIAASGAALVLYLGIAGFRSPKGRRGRRSAGRTTRARGAAAEATGARPPTGRAVDPA